MIISNFLEKGNPQPDWEAISLVAMLIAERLRQGLVSPTDAAIDLVESTEAARETAMRLRREDERLR